MSIRKKKVRGLLLLTLVLALVFAGLVALDRYHIVPSQDARNIDGSLPTATNTPIDSVGSSSPSDQFYSGDTRRKPAPIPQPMGDNGVSGVACTMEAKFCPDGSYVGRSGPKCEFAPCP